MSCDGRRDQILSYLTDGLDSAEREDLETHLESGCPHCEAELSSARETLGAVAFAVTPVRPPESAKRRLMERIRHHRKTPAHPPRNAVSTDNSQSAPLTTVEPKPTLTDRVIRSARSSRRRRYLFAQFLSPTIAAGLAVAVTYGIMTAEIREDRLQVDQLANEVGLLKENLSTSQSRLAELEAFQDVTRDLWDLMESNKWQYAQLRGRDNGHPSYWARLVVDIEKRLGYFFAGDSVPLTREKRYSLWLEPEENGAPIQAAEFTFNGRGPIPLELHLPDEPRRYTTISIYQLGDDDDDEDGQPAAGLLIGTFDRPRL